MGMPARETTNSEKENMIRTVPFIGLFFRNTLILIGRLISQVSSHLVGKKILSLSSPSMSFPMEIVWRRMSMEVKDTR